MKKFLALIILLLTVASVSAAIPPPAEIPSFGSSSSSTTTTTTRSSAPEPEEEDILLPPTPAAPGVESEPIEFKSPASSFITPQFLIVQAEIALVTIIGGVLYFFGRKKTPASSQASTNNNLKPYVRSMLQRGYSKSQLQQTLLSAGYEMKDIIEAFKP